MNLVSESKIFLPCLSAFPPTEEWKTCVIYLTPRHHLEQQPAQTATDVHHTEVKSLHEADAPFIQNTGSVLLYFPQACRHFKGVNGMICRPKCGARLSRPVRCLTLFCLNGNDGGLWHRFKGKHPHIMASDINRPPCRRGSKCRLPEWM